MATAVAKRLMNTEEYTQMAEAGILKPNDRVELINGEILHMSPVGSRHAAVVKNLSRLLNKSLFNQALIGIQDPIITNDFNEPEPDISILKLKNDFYSSSHPKSKDTLLIIEVSDSTLENDRSVKSEIYGSSGIPEYWIVNLIDEHIEIYSKPDAQGYLHREIKKMDTQVAIMGSSFSVSDIIIS